MRLGQKKGKSLSYEYRIIIDNPVFSFTESTVNEFYNSIKESTFFRDLEVLIVNTLPGCHSIETVLSHKKRNHILFDDVDYRLKQSGYSLSARARPGTNSNILSVKFPSTRGMRIGEYVPRESIGIDFTECCFNEINGVCEILSEAYEKREYELVMQMTGRLLPLLNIPINEVNDPLSRIERLSSIIPTIRYISFRWEVNFFVHSTNGIKREVFFIALEQIQPTSDVGIPDGKPLSQMHLVSKIHHLLDSEFFYDQIEYCNECLKSLSINAFDNLFKVSRPENEKNMEGHFSRPCSYLLNAPDTNVYSLISERSTGFVERCRWRPRQTTLMIHHDGQYNIFIYSIIEDGASPISFPPVQLSTNNLARLKDLLINLRKEINSCIIRKQKPNDIIEKIVRPLGTILLPDELKIYLSSIAGHDPIELHLSFNPDLSAIPWEKMLSGETNGNLIFVRRFSNRFNAINAWKRADGFLFIIGSGIGIEGFSKSIECMYQHLVNGITENVEIIHAQNYRSILKKLTYIRYKAVIYTGHGRSGSDKEDSGWICQDGSVFNCNHLESLRQMGTAPELIFANACESASSLPFSDVSMPCSALYAGCRAYIGSPWLLDFEKSKFFLERMTGIINDGWKNVVECFSESVNVFTKHYGENDTYIDNIIIYIR